MNTAIDYDVEIKKIKKKYGKKLLIIAHHYQRDEIVRYADKLGDSFQLAQFASVQEEAEYIVFGGVRFMVEAAAVLAKPHQKVLHPNMEAGCPLAQKASEPDVLKAWKHLGTVTDNNQIIPVVYVNSDVELKAFCGESKGLTCTSSNATKAFQWAFEQGEKVFFFPDEFLGRNTSNLLGIKDSEIAVWDPNIENGGLKDDEIKYAKVLLWKGFCLVHTFFKTEHVENIRAKYPEIKVIVHPECKPEIVKAADGAGSTKFICEYVKNAKPGAKIAIGTEFNLVQRLANKNPDKTIVPLKESICANMFKTTIENLHYTLANLETYQPTTVEEKYIENTKIALNRMLKL